MNLSRDRFTQYDSSGNRTNPISILSSRQKKGRGARINGQSVPSSEHHLSQPKEIFPHSAPDEIVQGAAGVSPQDSGQLSPELAPI